MHPALTMDEMDSSEDAGAQDGPDFLLAEGVAIPGSIGDLLLQRVIGVLKDKDDFVEGRAERVFGFSREVEEV